MNRRRFIFSADRGNRHARIILIFTGMTEENILPAANLIDAGHYGLEQLFVPYMAGFLRERFPGLELFIQAPPENAFLL